MKTQEQFLPAGFVLLNDSTCCVVAGGMASDNVTDQMAYMLGKMLGKAARVLYDLGESLVFKIKAAPLFDK